MDNKLTKKLLLSFLFFICFTIFLIQLWVIFSAYFSGETVLTIGLRGSEAQTPPALTICFPQYLSMERVANNNENLTELYTEYLNIVDKLQEQPQEGGSSDEEKSVRPDLATQMKLAELYESVTNTVNMTTISAHELLTKFTIPDDGLKLLVFGILHGEVVSENFMETKSNEFTVIQSLRRDDLPPMKCFTFFSHLCTRCRSFRIENGEFVVRFQGSYKWFPLSIFKNFYFSIHSPNSLPDLKTTDVIHNIEYNKMTTELLGSPYDTNCYEYDLDYKFANFNMRSDCIANCIQKSIKNDCNLKGMIAYNYMVREDMVRLNRESITTDNVGCQMSLMRKTKSKCNKMCKNDCHFEYYSVEHWVEAPHDDNFYNQVILSIKHNSLPDYLFRYVPRTTFISILYNVFGIIGMWLGVLHFFR